MRLNIYLSITSKVVYQFAKFNNVNIYDNYILFAMVKKCTACRMLLQIGVVLILPTLLFYQAKFYGFIIYIRPIYVHATANHKSLLIKGRAQYFNFLVNLYC